MFDRLATALRPWRGLVVSVFDTLAWVFSLTICAWLRYDSAATPVPLDSLVLVSAAAVGLHLSFSSIARLPQGRAALGSFEETLLLGAVIMTSGMFVSVGNALLLSDGGSGIARSVPVAATFMTLVLAFWGRAMWRWMLEARYPRSDHSVPVVIVGAGEGGRQLVKSMLLDSGATWRPVAFVDDDPRKRHLRVKGIPVAGTTEEVAEVARSRGARTVIIAIPSAGARVIRRISDHAHEHGLTVKVLPGVAELFDARVGVSDVRDIDVVDLLGRHQIDTDIAAIAGYLTGKRVLVTGAGGSIGSELCKQIHQYVPSELIMLDRDESALHAVQLAIYGQAMLDTPDVVLGDIRDEQFLRALFAERRPEVVFHAAALKHLPMLEQYPGEAVKTNVWGTQSVLEAADAVGVERFVNISTDKAANPISVLGYSKRIAESLTAAMAERSSGTYLSVRFGNVLGSRGSVLTSFASQIAGGGPVTVTHPEVTRFFMTVQEAVQLVIQAAAIGRDGEALVLDMGDPVRISSVAEQLITMSGREVDIIYTGLRDGEKMHEELFGREETDLRPRHPQVSHTYVPPLPGALARELDPFQPTKRLISSLRALTVRIAADGVMSQAMR